MSMFLRNSGIVRLCFSAVVRRSYSSKSEIRGLVLGAYTSEEKCIELTPSAKKVDEKLCGKLTESLAVAGKLKEGSCRTFWGLAEDFNAVTIVGMGKKDKGYNSLENICEDRECARVSAAAGCKELERYDVHNICVESFQHPECAAEGSHLAVFKFQEYRTKPKPESRVHFYSATSDKSSETLWKNGAIKAQGQNIARRLADKPGNKLTPTIFGAEVQKILADCKNVKVDVHGIDWITKKNMGAFLSVAAGSHEEPKFVEITYTNADECPPLVLVGKGVTFDTGGISLKPSKGMDKMRGDMGGAACIIGATHAIAQLNLKLNLKCLIPLTDNMISSTATRPGDVITAMNGKTIAVDNTDAEGRLILADALSYSECFKPKFVVDLATLTGAISVALGKGAAGVYANNHDLFRVLEDAGARTGDRVWRMPLWDLYTKAMTDCTAYDLQNVADGVGGGSCTAAGFLREFVPKGVDWMHIDIANVYDPPQPQVYLKTGMSGRPTRTLIEFLSMNQG